MTIAPIVESLKLRDFQVRRLRGGRAWIYAADGNGARFGHLFDWATRRDVLLNGGRLRSEAGRLQFWNEHVTTISGYCGKPPPCAHRSAMVCAFVQWVRLNPGVLSSGAGPIGYPAAGRVVAVKAGLVGLPVSLRIPHDFEWLSLQSWLQSAPDDVARLPLVGDFGRQLTSDPELSDLAADFIVERVVALDRPRARRRGAVVSVGGAALGGAVRVNHRFTARPSAEIHRASEAGVFALRPGPDGWLDARLDLYQRLSLGVEGYEAEIAPVFHKLAALEAFLGWWH